MKKLILTVAAISISLLAAAQEYAILPAVGKTMNYKLSAETPMGNQNMDIKQFVKEREGDKIVLVTEVMGNVVNVPYIVNGDNLELSLKDQMASTLSQMGEFEVISENGVLLYPDKLKVGEKLGGAELKIKTVMQGMELNMDIDMSNRNILPQQEAITVPAGTYECYVLEEQTNIAVMGQTQQSTIKTWYATGVGMIKQTTDAGMVKTTTELVKID